MSWRHSVTSNPLVRSRASFAARLSHSSPSVTPDAPPSNTPPSGPTSSKLWADVLKEEQPPPSKVVQELLNKEENWTGDERIEDTVLRMLVDKYKPLRSGTIQSAEEKIRARKDDVTPFRPDEAFASTSTNTTNPAPKTKVDPATHRPWHTTFQAPSHSTIPQVKYGTPQKHGARKTPTLPQAALADPRVRAAARIAKKRVETTGRITKARESTLDYRLGAKSGGDGAARTANPNSVRGWTSLVEERIDQARRAGQFNNISGRGKPIEWDLEERNPFLGREEFFMNRIVKRNGAAPPWIELQKEVDDALTSFRRILQQGWVRRASRMLKLTLPANTLRALSAREASRFRDSEWEKRESGYHNTAVGEINGLIRKYNAMAPYAVRRTYITKDGELERCFDLAGAEIIQSFKNVYGGNMDVGNIPGVGFKDENEKEAAAGTPLGAEATPTGTPFSLREFLLRWIARLSGNRSQVQ